MDWQDLFSALALMLIFESLLPTVNPAYFREILNRLLDMDDQSIQSFGMTGLLVGLAVLYLARNSMISL